MVMLAAEPTDAALCEMVRAGDRDAADALVRRHTGLLKRVVLKRVSIVHPDADNLIQLGRLALLDAARGYDPAGGSKYSSFAYQAVVWSTETHLSGRDREVLLDETASYDDMPDPRPPAGEAQLRTTVPGWLKMALVRLPGQQRQVLALLYGLGGEQACDQHAAAARLGLTRDAVSGLHRRALLQLRTVGSRRAAART